MLLGQRVVPTGHGREGQLLHCGPAVWPAHSSLPLTPSWLDICAISPTPSTFLAPFPAFSLPWHLFLVHIPIFPDVVNAILTTNPLSYLLGFFFFQSVLFLSLVLLSLPTLLSINTIIIVSPKSGESISCVMYLYIKNVSCKA